MERWMVKRRGNECARTFFGLMRGASLEDWCRFSRFEDIREKVLFYDYTSKSMLSADGVQWPILFSHGSYSQKHVFHDKKLPSLEKFSAEIKIFCNKLQWSSLSRGGPAEQGEDLVSV